jgi:ABC-type uncharacterized transport system ATPase subunit
MCRPRKLVILACRGGPDNAARGRSGGRMAIVPHERARMSHALLRSRAAALARKRSRLPDVAIATERLTKSYGSARGIVDLSLDVAAGEIFGFLGPNGAGKTTTIRTVLDIIRPTSGRARILGMDSHARAVEIHRHVGYLPGGRTST